MADTEVCSTCRRRFVERDPERGGFDVSVSPECIVALRAIATELGDGRWWAAEVLRSMLRDIDDRNSASGSASGVVTSWPVTTPRVAALRAALDDIRGLDREAGTPNNVDGKPLVDILSEMLVEAEGVEFVSLETKRADRR